ncbi:hypothetical protein NG726_27750 [Pseudomonas sp. MOB-449]|nr:hypothetical protein [Pseudomonas sp. MOB-449]
MDPRIAVLIGDNQFELSLYQSAVRNLTDAENRLRFNNFAYAMRELSRHILHRLAPAEEVLQCEWYTNQTQSPDGVTRIQRAIYATQGGLSDEYVRTTLNIDPSAAHRALKNAIDALSRYTHIEEAVFDLPPDEVELLVTDTTEAFAGFAAMIKACRDQVVDGLELAIHENAVQEVLGDSLLAVDELAPHFSLDEVYVDSAEVSRITHDAIHLIARGTLSVTLQWGSNSDLRRGDGAELEQNFEFSCELTCPVADPVPAELEVVEDSVLVDTGNWHDRCKRPAKSPSELPH